MSGFDRDEEESLVLFLLLCPAPDSIFHGQEY